MLQYYNVVCRAHKESMCCKGLNNLWLYVCRKHSRFLSSWMHKCPGEGAWRQSALHHYGPVLLWKFCLAIWQQRTWLGVNVKGYTLNFVGILLWTKPLACRIWILSLLGITLLPLAIRNDNVHLCPPVS